jgi:16S rRNA G1207 methylase RsmC
LSATFWQNSTKIEIFASAYEQIDASQQELRIVDFGSGKGYLTFAFYERHLQKNLND